MAARDTQEPREASGDSIQAENLPEGGPPSSQIAISESERELEQLKARLEEQVARIQEGFFGGSEEDLSGELSSADQHPADTATMTESREMNLTVGRILTGRREDVVRALEKIKEGTYGICDLGGETIDPERLKARPEAVFCLEHQRLVERERQGERVPRSSELRRAPGSRGRS